MVREVIRYNESGAPRIYDEPPLDLEGREIPERLAKWTCHGCGEHHVGGCWLSKDREPLCMTCWEESKR